MLMIFSLIWCLSGIAIAEKLVKKEFSEDEYIAQMIAFLPMLFLFTLGPLNYFTYKYWLLKL